MRWNSKLSGSAAAVAMALLAACSPKSPAEVSKSGLAEVRQAHTAITAGEPKKQVLDSFKVGNKVRLGTAVLDGVTIEEWKVEAFHDESKRKDLFVTFLYFVDDRFVDSSDTRIDFRNNPALLERWQGAATAR